VDVLIDLNGHTRGSGLPLLKHRPAPVQLSWLGYPLTTGRKAQPPHFLLQFSSGFTFLF
jgi:predicted O-linked N-acetylglucosamine transferase (SPINDLY family)